MDPAFQFYSESLCLQEPMRAALKKGDSVIQQWYHGKTAFITGGSGYLGKLLVEKLIRASKLKKIYILIRGKKGKSVKDRLEELLNDPLFNDVRQEQPDFTKVVQGIQGDVAEIGLGISAGDRQTLTEEVDIIFHLAATTRFDETLKLATLINVRGTRELLVLAKECKNLKSIVHVSTAFTYATYEMIGKEVSELFYQSPVSPEALIGLVESASDERLNAISKDMILGWPNTYTFTKAVSEELVRNVAGELPICVFRPAIVFCPYYEPDPGYVDYSCLYSTTGIIFGVALGAMRVLFTKRDVRLCYVPADFTVNAAIACGWKTAITANTANTANEANDTRPKEVNIYTLSSSKCNIGFYVISDALNTKGRALATPKSIWYNFLVETNNVVYYKVCLWLLHYLPAYLVDAVCNVFNIKLPKGVESFVNLYTKMEKMMSVYSYYLTKEWYIRDDNMAALYDSLPQTDKDLYCFDVMKVDWEKLILVWGMGVRRHLIKDGLEGTVYGTKKQKFFQIANYIILVLFVYIIFVFLRFVISWFV